MPESVACRSRSPTDASSGYPLDALDVWLKGALKNEGIRPTALPPPDGLTMLELEGDFARLSVAWALSYAPTEIGKIMAPSEMPDIPRAIVRDYLGSYVSKDQM